MDTLRHSPKTEGYAIQYKIFTSGDKRAPLVAARDRTSVPKIKGRITPAKGRRVGCFSRLHKNRPKNIAAILRGKD
jgi:hypothetical protein